MSSLKKIFLFLFAFGLIFVPGITAAQYGLNETAGASGLTQRYPSDVPTLIGNVIGTALSMIAVIFFILMVYGGFLWMTAHGDSGQVDKAKDTIVAAIIGIIVVLASYAITNFVFSATGGSGGGGGGGGGGPVAPAGGGGAGDGAAGGGAQILCCVKDLGNDGFRNSIVPNEEACFADHLFCDDPPGGPVEGAPPRCTVVPVATPDDCQ